MALSKILLAVAIGAALGGCGGGGSSPATVTETPPAASPPPVVAPPVVTPPPASAGVAVGVAGVYDVDYNGFTGIYTMLDNGDFYGIHQVSDGTVLAGHPHGKLTTQNAVDAKEPIAWANFIDARSGFGFQEPHGMFGRTFTPSMVTVAITGSMGSFTASQSRQKTWNAIDARTLYLDALPMATIAGGYHGILRTVGSGHPQASVTDFIVDASGTFTATAIGCSFSGTMVQHGVTGIFDLQAQSGGTGCTFTTALKGIVTPTSVDAGKPTLAFQLDSADNTLSAVFFITKS